MFWIKYLVTLVLMAWVSRIGHSRALPAIAPFCNGNICDKGDGALGDLPADLLPRYDGMKTPASMTSLRPGLNKTSSFSPVAESKLCVSTHLSNRSRLILFRQSQAHQGPIQVTRTAHLQNKETVLRRGLTQQIQGWIGELPSAFEKLFRSESIVPELGADLVSGVIPVDPVFRHA